jgi:putative chitinase
MINRLFFFDRVNATIFGGKLGTKPRIGLNAMLDYWESHTPQDDDRWLAYALGTAHHETDRTFGPIREYGLGKGKDYGPPPDPQTGQVYYGRGLVQLTWKRNYARMAPLVGANLVQDADLALDLAFAVPILFIGMKDGIFTGKKFADYFNSTTENWEGARRIVNGKDKAKLIADYSRNYYSCISYTI